MDDKVSELELRITELEDQLKKFSEPDDITKDEIAAYRKVRAAVEFPDAELVAVCGRYCGRYCGRFCGAICRVVMPAADQPTAAAIPSEEIVACGRFCGRYCGRYCGGLCRRPCVVAQAVACECDAPCGGCYPGPGMPGRESQDALGRFAGLGE